MGEKMVENLVYYTQKKIFKQNTAKAEKQKKNE